jgi:hypothetical protein
MNKKSQISTYIKKMVLSIFIAYALIFQGMFTSVLSSELSHKTENNFFFDVICYSGQNITQSADETGSKSQIPHLKHKHCALCQIGQQVSILDVSLIFHPVKYHTSSIFDQITYQSKSHNRYLKSIYPPLIQSRGPPVQA